MSLSRRHNHKIYKLDDPRDKSIHYVGRTRKELLFRLRQHITMKDNNPLKRVWIDELRELGLDPLISLIEDGLPELLAEKRETYWIEYYWSQGEPLTNVDKISIKRRSPVSIALRET